MSLLFVFLGGVLRLWQDQVIHLTSCCSHTWIGLFCVLFSPLWPLASSSLRRILQQQNEDLQRRLSLSNHRMEAMEAEFDSSRHYMEAELSRTRDDLDKMRDKFRRWRRDVVCLYYCSDVIMPWLVNITSWPQLSLLLFEFCRKSKIKSGVMWLDKLNRNCADWKMETGNDSAVFAVKFEGFYFSLQTSEQLHSISESQSGPGGEASCSGKFSPCGTTSLL